MARVIVQCSKEKAREAIFYSYTKHINGFAANLDAATAAEIASEPFRPCRRPAGDHSSTILCLIYYLLLQEI